jgi:hypothetical protein
MSTPHTPLTRLRWAAVCAVGAAALVGTDWLLRVAGATTAMAPTPTALGLSLALGAALGAAAAAWDRYALVKHRGHLLAFFRAPLAARLSWRYQKTNLLLYGWQIAALLALIGWCVYSGVFVLPALLAANAVQFAANRKLAAEFELDRHRRAAA